MGDDWQRVPGLPTPTRTGELGELTELMARGGIGRAVILLFPRSAEHYRALLSEPGGAEREDEIRERIKQEIYDYNRWGVAAARAEPRLLAFIGVNPRFLSESEITAEIDAMAAAGAAGVKIIPPAMGLYADDPLLQPVYQRASALRLPVLSQSGDGFLPPPAPGRDHFGRPRYHGHNLANFPRLTLILAHLGHGYSDDVVELAGRYDNLYTDTSFQLGLLDQPGEFNRVQMADLFRRIGVERVLLGSNFPMVDPIEYVHALQSLPLSSAEHDLVGFGNARRALGLTA